MIRVLIADDQDMVRAGFRMILDATDGIEVVGEVDNGRDAVTKALHLRPDVCLFDVRMPELDGIAATSIIAGPDVAEPLRVVVITTFDLDEYVFAALQAGAAGFLLKDTPPEALIDAVQVIAAGEALLAPSITKRLIAEFAKGATVGSPADLPGFGELTERETEVLVAMARGMSNAEIAETLFVGETTVKTHVGRVLMKLGVRDRVQAVVAAYESGLVTPGQS